MSEQTFSVAAACKAQEEFCKNEKLPHFAPGNGICWRCHKNIYEQLPYGRTDHLVGISVERAGSEHVTGCPHCNRSYCD